MRRVNREIIDIRCLSTRVRYTEIRPASASTASPVICCNEQTHLNNTSFIPHARVLSRVKADGSNVNGTHKKRATPVRR